MKGILRSLAAMVVAFPSAFAAELLVPEDFPSIQEAVDQARNGGLVLVGPGEYRIEEPITLGKFSVTLRSRAGPRVTIIRMSETPLSPGRASVVIVPPFSRGAATLDGFTITGGKGTAVSTGDTTAGGGILCGENTSLVIRNCRIVENSSRRGGGVHCNLNSSPTMTNCTITGNTARYGGGGIYCLESSHPLVENCTVTGNAALHGGGIHGEVGAAIVVKNSIIWGNAGASLSVRSGSGPVVSFSDVESAAPFPGEGNLNADPLYCAWGDRNEVFVDAARPGPGDGSREHPFRELRAALRGFSLSLSSRSPCLAAGEAGSDMGADHDLCGEPGLTSRLVRLLPGRYALEGTNLAPGISIEGAGEDETVIEGTIEGLRSGSRLAGVTVTRGSRGGVVVGMGEKPEIRDSWIRGNAADSIGGGIHIFGASPVISNCKITGNVAAFIGGGLYCESASQPVLVHCTISGNSAQEYGGVYNRGPRLTLASSIVWDNVGGSIIEPWDWRRISFSCIEGSDDQGGPGIISEDPLFRAWPGPREVHVDAASPGPGSGTPGDPFPTLAGAFQGFSVALAPGSPCRGTGENGSDMGASAGSCAAAGGPDRLVILARGTYEVEGLTLAQRVSLSGAGEAETTLSGTVHGLRTGSSIEGVTIRGGWRGGLIVNTGESPVVRRTAITIDPAAVMTPYFGNGVEVNSGGMVTLQDCALRGNPIAGLNCPSFASALLVDCEISGNSDNGLVVNWHSSVRMEGCTISRNGLGGIFLLDSSSILKDCSITGNFENGLHLFSAAAMLEGCSIRDNALSGVMTEFNGTIALLNCLLAGNAYLGVDANSSTVRATNCTVADQLADPSSGGILAWGGSTVSLLNSILWGNRNGSVLHGSDSSVQAAFSLIEGPEVLPGAGNLNQDPRFAGPGDYRLAAGSPAIDAGQVAGAPFGDLEGHGRPCGKGVDLGAFEAGGCPFSNEPFRRGDANGDGTSDLSDAVFILEHLFLGGPAAPCQKSMDLDDDGGLAVTDPVLLLAHLFLAGPEPEPPFRECGADSTLDLLTCVSVAGC